MAAIAAGGLFSAFVHILSTMLATPAGRTFAFVRATTRQRVAFAAMFTRVGTTRVQRHVTVLSIKSLLANTQEAGICARGTDDAFWGIATNGGEIQTHCVTAFGRVVAWVDVTWIVIGY